jgi:hypothetical protein
MLHSMTGTPKSGIVNLESLNLPHKPVERPLVQTGNHDKKWGGVDKEPSATRAVNSDGISGEPT